MSKFRSFSDIAKLYKRSYLILLGLMVIVFISLAAISISAPNSPLSLLLMIIVLINLGLSNLPREQFFYNKSVRADELSKKNHEYENYVSEVWNIFKSHGIDNDEKILKLKVECENTLKMYEDKYTKINNRIADMLIGAPLGALIASIISSDSEVILTAIGVIIFGGLAFLGILKLLYLISFYFEGYFKDRCLLDSVNELDYFSK